MVGSDKDVLRLEVSVSPANKARVSVELLRAMDVLHRLHQLLKVLPALQLRKRFLPTHDSLFEGVRHVLQCEEAHLLRLIVLPHLRVFLLIQHLDYVTLPA